MSRKTNGATSAQSAGVRCAIYTRKSTEEGLEQEFNSLDAQRESAEAYIKSQQHEGWTCLPDRYDDGGFTGGNMERPALRRLMADIEAGRIDCVVVYKVDRLSRSLLDFAQLMGKFDKHQIAFVSVTQQFNTTNSMGRLMLNVLLSFAQFEREIISERTRDKIAATRRKGKWCGDGSCFLPRCAVGRITGCDQADSASWPPSQCRQSGVRRSRRGRSSRLL
jgi:site-specific DNA recombinase